MKRICVVSDGQPSTNPRMVKEADALYEAGYDVTVIFCQGWADWATESDKELLSTRKWKFRSIQWSKKLNPYLFYKSRLRFFLARLLYSRGLLVGWKELALDRVYPELLKMVLNERADLYIAHYLGALSAAARASKRYKARLGFDAEDLHGTEGDVGDRILDHKMPALAEAVQKKYLPKCDYVTAASEPIANAYVKNYHVRRLTTILNVFPLAMRKNSVDGCLSEALSLYWFSQTIGPGRGIEDAIVAMGMVRSDIKLYLQGRVDNSYKEKIFKVAFENKLTNQQIVFMEPTFPEELVNIASQFDVGLALEPTIPLNRDLCVTNKMFVYLLAGVSIIATGTKGQMSILKTIGEGGWTYRAGDVPALAARLEFLATHRQELEDSKKEALRYAQERYNWDIEKHKFLDVIQKVLD